MPSRILPKAAFGAACLGVALTGRNASAIGGWTPTGSMANPHERHTATTLLDGRILIVAGHGIDGFEPVATTEIFNPSTETFEPGPELLDARAEHTATLLLDGRVLVAGGAQYGGQESLASTAIFDPATGQWTQSAPMLQPRTRHAAARLADGRVLVVGGNANGVTQTLATSEIYDPTADSWESGPALTEARERLSATALPDGRIVVIGGMRGNFSDTIALAELYDPAGNTFADAGELIRGRFHHETLLLGDGRGLVVNGYGNVENGVSTFRSVELFDSSAGGSFEAGPDTFYQRERPAAVLLPDGSVLVTQYAAELLDPALQGPWKFAGLLREPRLDNTASLLGDGRVLVVGGRAGPYPDDRVVRTAEIWDRNGTSFKPIGYPCAGSDECETGFCVDEYCCDTACDNGSCDTCAVDPGFGFPGTCTPTVRCDPYVIASCAAAEPECKTSCESDADCVDDFVCDAATHECHYNIESPGGGSPGDDDSQTIDETDEGCSCRAGAATASPWILVGLAFAVALLRRARTV